MELINTVGTSVLQSWKDLGAGFDELHRLRLVAELCKLPETDRRLGAELTSIRSLINQAVVKPGDRLVFLVSDTREGAFVGGVLVQVAEAWGFAAEQRTIHKLQGEDPKAFAQGLRNLVREIAGRYRAVAACGEPVAINATGGYKAQISFAGLIGQVFRVPVYYQFEAFPQAIELPPLPVSFDFDEWLAYRDVFESLDDGEGDEFLNAGDPRVKALPPDLGVLLDRSQGLVTLNALGALYHEGFKSRFLAQAERLVPRDAGLAPDAKPIRYEDANHGKHEGLADFFRRLVRVPYVKRVQTVRYVPQKPTHARFRPDPAQADRIKGTYWDGRVAVEYGVYVSEADPRKARAAAADLAERMR